MSAPTEEENPVPNGQAIDLRVEVGGQRLDRYLAESLSGLSRSQIQRLIRDGRVSVDGRSVKASSLVEPGSLVAVQLPSPRAEEIVPQPIILDIVYEDSDLLVVNKPAGMVVHPGSGHQEGTLVNALLSRYPCLAAGDDDRPGIVHRLDQDTSGLIAVAKTEGALKYLQAQFRQRLVEKTYLVLVHGYPPAPEGIIEAPIGRDARRRKQMAVMPGGRAARTAYRVQEEFDDYSLLAVSLETGRTHQIRVHLAWLGVPVVGDKVYGRRRNPLNLSRQFLHAWSLSFERPDNKGRLDLECSLPAELERALLALKTSSNT